MAGKLSELNRK